MWFNSFLYLAFFGAVVVLHFATPSWRARKILLLVASYVFYASWNPPFVLLLFASTLIDYEVGKRLARSEVAATRKFLLIVSCVVNLGILGFFKYAGFLLETFTAFAAALGVPLAGAAPPDYITSIVLPAGISFYVFQSLSYTIDIYRREIPPAGSALDFFLFVSFFPQLVAGPIVRAKHLLPQLARRPRATLRDWEDGGGLIILGLFQKMVLADNLAPLAELVFAHPGNFSTVATWLGVYAFAFQIYFDFAGYSNIAIGSARIFGIHLLENFRNPYVSTSLREFWTRWHISLSEWIRDYLYVPLGGSRGTRRRTIVNLIATMGLAGLWHGAAWTFVVWGLLHGLFLTLEHVTFGRERASRPNAGHAVVRWLLTFHLVCIAWVFFRASSFLEAAWILEQMLSPSGVEIPAFGFERLPYVFAVMGFLLCSFLLRGSALLVRVPRWGYAVAAAVLLFLTIVSYGDATEFIYFRF